MPRYPILLFDADGTLFDFEKAEENALYQAFRTFGFSCTPDIYHRYHEINRSLWLQLEQGLITRERLKTERFSQLFQQIGQPADPEAFGRCYTDFLSQGSFLLDGALELCQSLSRYCRLSIITNGNLSVQKKRFYSSPLVPYFERLFISEELGCNKPEKAFFDKVLTALEIRDPSQALVIGDSLSSDILGGVHSGLDTCWVNFKKEINHSGILPTFEISSFRELLPIVEGQTSPPRDEN